MGTCGRRCSHGGVPRTAEMVQPRCPASARGASRADPLGPLAAARVPGAPRSTRTEAGSLCGGDAPSTRNAAPAPVGANAASFIRPNRAMESGSGEAPEPAASAAGRGRGPHPSASTRDDVHHGEAPLGPLGSAAGARPALPSVICRHGETNLEGAPAVLADEIVSRHGR